MRTCVKCGKDKSESEFYVDTNNADGTKHACKTCVRRQVSEYSKTDRGRELQHAKEARMRKKYPLKARARSYVKGLVFLKKIPRASDLACVQCGNPAREYHHHKGYEKEFKADVVPVCRQCHISLEV